MQEAPMQTQAFQLTLYLPDAALRSEATGGGTAQQEHLRTVLLDTRNRVISIPTVYIGSLNSASVRVGEVFREAICASSACIVSGRRWAGR
jgi:DNA repair protein RadC